MRATIGVIAVVAAIAGAATYGWRWLFPDDEAQIHALLDRIADVVGGSASAGDVSRLARVASLRKEFEANVTVDVGPPFDQISGRDAVIGIVAKVNGSVRNLDVSFADVTIQVDPEGSGATATLTAEARFDDDDDRRGIDARELDLTFRRVDGAWVVAAVTMVRTLRRLDQP